MRRTLIHGLLSAALLAAVSVLTGAVPAAAQAIITNGTVTLGVNPEGHLNADGTVPSPVMGTTIVGLRLNANGEEALSHASPCEGWGVGIATGLNFGTSGWANRCFTLAPVQNLMLQSFSATSDSATSVVTIRDGSGSDLLEVTHEWQPSFWPNLYQANVTIRNITSAIVGDPLDNQSLRYRRVMDWDVERTTADEHVTIGGLHPSLPLPLHMWFSSDDGFEIADPLRFQFGFPVDLHELDQLLDGVPSPVPCGFTTNFTRCGRYLTPFGFPEVTDHGALFDFTFPGLLPGEARSFAIFYGAAPTTAGAHHALYQVGAEVYSLAQCRPFETDDFGIPVGGDPACDLASGAPTTFVFGAAGIGGAPAFGDIFGVAFHDTNGNGVLDFGLDLLLPGVTVTLTGTDLDGAPITRTAVTDGDGFYDIDALPQGTYSVAGPSVAAGLGLVTVSPVAVSLGGPAPYVQVDFGYRPTRIRGDLDGDGDVDKDDFAILYPFIWAGDGHGVPANGPNDPLDLNGDGRIDWLDVWGAWGGFKSLCTRPNCATQ
jgi:type IV pilus assembly protein PilY1